MSATVEPDNQQFTCRHCGLVRVYSSPFHRIKREILKLLKMKNSRWGVSCIECVDLRTEPKHEKTFKESILDMPDAGKDSDFER